MQSATRGDGPGAGTQGEAAMAPPGANDGRGGVVTPFHGHMVSLWLCPGGFPSGTNDAAVAGLNRPLFFCHFAHRRSTLQWSRKNRGSLGTVAGLKIQPPKLVCANPCGSPSIDRNALNAVPIARVCASF